MGMDAKTKEVIKKIGDLEDKHCRGCQKREDFRTAETPYPEILNYCTTVCPIGKKIRRLGGILDYGVVTNYWMKAADLTKEKYITLRKTKTDKQIRDDFQISKATLNRRKKAWGLADDPQYQYHQTPLTKLTKEEFQALVDEYTDGEIAEKLGVSRVAVLRRRKRMRVSRADWRIEDKFAPDEYRFLKDKHDLKDTEIAELWEISASALLQLKHYWGFTKASADQEPLDKGLTKEKLRELMKDHTDGEIAEMYGMSKGSVFRYRKRLGLFYRNSTKREKVDPQWIKKRLATGTLKKDLAAEMGIHPDTLTQWIRYFKDKNLY